MKVAVGGGLAGLAVFRGNRRAGGRPPTALLTAADAVRVAAADIATFAARDPQRAYATKYLSAHHLTQRPKELFELFQVLCLHVNLLSTKGFIEPLQFVRDGGTWLWRLDLRRYGWTGKLFAQLILGKGPFAVDPWFHVLSPEAVPGFRQNAAGLTPMPAPWLPEAETVALGAATQSHIPVVRADWFLHRTAIQAGRDGFGYYDFLGLKTRDDFDRLTGLDRKEAVKIFREKAAIIRESGVATSGSRQLFALGGRGGRVWVTKDVSVDSFGQAAQNVLDQRFEDLKHKAEEGVGVLPNELPVFYASDAAGVLQKVVPDTIAGHDTTATGRDDRIHIGPISCLACHEKAGLKPFKDLERQPGRPPNVTDARREDLYDRTRAAYEKEIRHQFDADVLAFTAALAEACDLTPGEVSKAYRRCYDAYDAADVTPAVFAADVGLTEAEFLGRLKGRLDRKPDGAFTPYPPTLANYLARVREPISRGKQEELVPYLMPILSFPGIVKEQP